MCVCVLILLVVGLSDVRVCVSMGRGLSDERVRMGRALSDVSTQFIFFLCIRFFENFF